MSGFAVHARTALLDPSQLAQPDQLVLVTDGFVSAVGPREGLLHQVPSDFPVHQVETLLPGMTDAHSHARGYPLAEQDLPASADLLQLLLEFTAHTHVAGADDALAAGADLAATGVTSVRVVHHTFGGATDYVAALGETTDALAHSGLAMTVALGITDRWEYVPSAAEHSPLIPQPFRQPDRRMSSADWVSTVATIVGRQTDTVTSWEVAPVNPVWCTPALLAAAARISMRSALGVHTHLLEAEWQRGSTPGGTTRRLAEAGLLSDRFSAAHGVWLDQADLAALGDCGGQLVHCPLSNQALKTGPAHLRDWLDHGITAAIGLDSNTPGRPDVFDALRSARQTAQRRGDHVSAAELLGAATRGGAASLRHPRWAGVIEVGARADLVGLDLRCRVASAAQDIVDTATQGHVTLVWGRGGLLFDRAQGHQPEVAAARHRIGNALLEDRARRQAALATVRASLDVVREAWGTDRQPDEMS